MNVTLCNDNALGNLNLTARSYDLAARSTGDVTALSDNNRNADGTSVGSGKLYLGSRSFRSENGNICKGLLRSYNRYSLFTSILSRL